MSANDLSALIDSVPPGGAATLNPPRKEFQGPLVLRRPVVVNGQGGTIWAERGPVVVIESGGVELVDLTVEITGPDAGLKGEAACALVVRGGVGPKLTRVAVRGNVLGLSGEDGEWDYPRSLRLNKLRAGAAHIFLIRLKTPVPCSIESDVSGLSVQPRQLTIGPSEVTLCIDPASPGTRVLGALRLSTAGLTRRVMVSAHFTDEPNAAVGAGQVAYEPERWEIPVATVYSPPAADAPPTPDEAEATPPPSVTRSRARGNRIVNGPLPVLFGPVPPPEAVEVPPAGDPQPNLLWGTAAPVEPGTEGVDEPPAAEPPQPPSRRKRRDDLSQSAFGSPDGLP